jgi:hypothetical protein
MLFYAVFGGLMESLSSRMNEQVLHLFLLQLFS